MGVAGSITVQRERFAAFIAEARELVAVQADELNPHPDIPLDIDEETYLRGEAAGAVCVYTARADGVLIGYAVFVIHYGLNWRLTLQATQTAFFVDPRLRLSSAGTRLLQASDAELAAAGVALVMHPQFVKHPALGKLLERNGYEHGSNLWTKRLDKTGEIENG